ncbi:hypothetical protein LTS18_007605 [Coniosporium uncinatum]|uniref:Uncharacterized protein n=1 Tax=Coniosporium uncinatum TaxID=93489 RepID=A0ACC3D2C8_9PEZI|nr:hypothetical protein LTS18_007605 [Coniosporium uncinatum]
MDEVLTTTELLESILLHIPSRKLFTLRQVSHHCNAMLVKLTALQRLMHLAPTAPVLETEVVACDVPMRNSSGTIFPSAGMQIGKGHKLVTCFGGADVSGLATMNPLLRFLGESSGTGLLDDAKPATHPPTGESVGLYTIYVSSEEIFPRQPEAMGKGRSRYWEVYVSEPPTSMVVMDWLCGATRLTNMKVQRADGDSVRLGDALESLKPYLEDVENGLVHTWGRNYEA